jgi:hypothetical protein
MLNWWYIQQPLGFKWLIPGNDSFRQPANIFFFSAQWVSYGEFCRGFKDKEDIEGITFRYNFNNKEISGN